MYKKYGNKMLCFSPSVMLATFFVEFGFAFYVLFRYKINIVTRLVLSMLFLLGTFQLTEYMICGGLGLNHIDWARLGYASITLMPAIGLHLVLTLAKTSNLTILGAAYGTAIAYVIYFSTAGNALMGTTCSANYAIFNVNNIGSYIFAIYYYGWLLVSIGMAVFLARKSPKIAPAMRWMVAGYASFIIPTTLANIIDPSTIAGIPSVMCGFAVILAIILAWRVMPLSKTPLAQRSTKTQAKGVS
ncbi:MAG: hypothetical protein WAW80_00060 [Candidatus Saccharimonadales bacterium]